MTAFNSHPSRRARWIYPTLAMLGLAVTLPTEAIADDKLPVHISGDLRLRVEQDWDSQTDTGARRPDRARARIRARIAAAVDLGNGFSLLGRVRTGGENSQQNANITFADLDGNPVDRLHIVADQYALAWKGENGGGAVGRMAFPFFTQNEYFWDADISPLGVTANVTLNAGSSTKVKFVGGAFRLPVGLSHYSGGLFAGQLQVEDSHFVGAAGLFRFAADRGDPDRLILLDGDGDRDYTVASANGQARWSWKGKPLILGADFYRNLQGYGHSSDPISRAYDRARTGYVLSASWGDVATARHVQLGYRYFHIEKLAVNASYAHDDVGRLGTPNEADLTDLRGHDLFANYALTKRLSIGVRTMFIQRISTIENGKRARIDLGYSF